MPESREAEQRLDHVDKALAGRDFHEDAGIVVTRIPPVVPNIRVDDCRLALAEVAAQHTTRRCQRPAPHAHKGNVVQILKAIPLVVAVAGLPFVCGLLRWRLAAFVWAAAFLAFGVLIEISEPKSDDMPGLAVFLGVAVAAMSLLAWLLGAAIGTAWSRRSTRPK